MRFAPHAAIALLLAAPAALANPLSDSAGSTTVSYSNVKADYLVAGVERELTRERLMLDYSEMGNSWFYGGISAGLVFLDGESEPLIDDSSVPGYAFGVFGGIDLAFFDERLGVHLEGSYHREWVSGLTSTGDDTSMKFGDGSLRAGVSWRFSQVRLSAGAFSSNATGEIERTGLSPGTAQLEEVESSGAYAGLEIKLDGGYGFGARAESGARDTVALTFSTRF
jgi:hypothetical protein